MWSVLGGSSRVLFHYNRICEGGEYLYAVFSKDWKQTIKDFEDGQIKIKREYIRAMNHLNELIKDKVKENSMGNYLSRIEVDELLFRSFSNS